MSRRITSKSDIKEKDLAVSALASLDYKYRDLGNSLEITSGPLSQATINLTTGEVVSDSDVHRQEQLNGLRQAYQEAAYRRVVLRQGGTVESRSVNARGEIKLRVRVRA